MATIPQELFGPSNPQLPNLRAQPHEHGIAVGSLEALAADADVANLTPLFHTPAGTWGIWADADLRVDGFLWAPDAPHAGKLAGETNIQIFKRGVIHRDDVPLPAGQTQGLLDGLLESQDLRDAGITVQGLANVS